MNRSTVGDLEEADISVVVNQDFDCLASSGDPSWVKLLNEPLLNNTTMDLIVLKSDGFERFQSNGSEQRMPFERSTWIPTINTGIIQLDQHRCTHKKSISIKR